MIRFALKLSAAFFVFLSAAHGAYDNSWYVADFWSGEYPNGIAVVDQNVSVPARASMDLAAAKDIKCHLPQKAVYHPWNEKRPAQYVTASKIVPMIANDDFTYPADPKDMVVQKGEQIDYLIYYAEGLFAVRFKNEDYIVDQELLEKITYSEDQFQQDEWMKVPCVGGPEAWIFFHDLFDVDANGDMTYNPGFGDWWPGYVDYGQVEDLP